MEKQKLSNREKIDHIDKCEFHKGIKQGICPKVSLQDAKKIRQEQIQNNHNEKYKK